MATKKRKHKKRQMVRQVASVASNPRTGMDGLSPWVITPDGTKLFRCKACKASWTTTKYVVCEECFVRELDPRLAQLGLTRAEYFDRVAAWLESSTKSYEHALSRVT